MVHHPNYIDSIQPENIFQVMLWIVKFYFMLGFWIFLNTVFMVGFIWALLVVFRVMGIPWLDGTTKGFVNRS